MCQSCGSPQKQVRWQLCPKGAEYNVKLVSMPYFNMETNQSTSGRGLHANIFVLFVMENFRRKDQEPEFQGVWQRFQPCSSTEENPNGPLETKAR